MNDKVATGDRDIAAGNATERSNLYGFLAAVFRTEPTTELLARIGDPAFLEPLMEAGVDLGVDFSGDFGDGLIETLAVEYARLFIGPGDHVAPFAAVHLGGDGAMLWSRDTARVKAFIERAGFAYRPDYHDLPDHISAEMEFMHLVAAAEAEALVNGDAAEAERLRGLQRDFVGDHLAEWVPKFCRRIEDRAELPFYRGLAALTRDFIQSEKEALG